MRRLALLAGAVFASLAFAQGTPGIVNNLRGTTPLDAESRAAPVPRTVNDDVKRARSYPAQPPVIPHQTDNYQVDMRFNKCMDCHGRARTGESGAPMVSITHYQDRDGQIRQEISPRRYFCTACHVPQADVRTPVKNTFQDFYNVQPDAPAKGGAGR